MDSLDEILSSQTDESSTLRWLVTSTRLYTTGLPEERYVTLLSQAGHDELRTRWQGYVLPERCADMSHRLARMYGEHRIVTDCEENDSCVWTWSSESFHLFTGLRRHGKLPALLSDNPLSRPYRTYRMRCAAQPGRVVVARGLRRREYAVSNLASIDVWISYLWFFAGVSLRLKNGRSREIVRGFNVFPLLEAFDPAFRTSFLPDPDIEDDYVWAHDVGTHLATVLGLPCRLQDPHSRQRWRTA